MILYLAPFSTILGRIFGLQHSRTPCKLMKQQFTILQMYHATATALLGELESDSDALEVILIIALCLSLKLKIVFRKYLCTRFLGEIFDRIQLVPFFLYFAVKLKRKIKICSFWPR